MAVRPRAVSTPQGWNVIATMRTPREDVLPRSDRLRVLRARRHQSGQHRGSARRKRADRCARQQCGHRPDRRARSDADGEGARSVRDQHLRRDGDDASRAAAVPRAPLGRGGERDVERRHSRRCRWCRSIRQARWRSRLHRFARARACGLRRAREVGRAWLRPDHALHAELQRAHRRCDSRGVRAFRSADPCGIRAAGCRDDRVRCRRGCVACGGRYVRTIALSGGRGCGRGGADLSGCQPRAGRQSAPVLAVDRADLLPDLLDVAIVLPHRGLMIGARGRSPRIDAVAARRAVAATRIAAAAAVAAATRRLLGGLLILHALTLDLLVVLLELFRINALPLLPRSCPRTRGHMSRGRRRETSNGHTGSPRCAGGTRPTTRRPAARAARVPGRPDLPQRRDCCRWCRCDCPP